ncbi:MAG: hypothetical protein ACRD3E_17155 [Terriglobales bacterium]
MGQPDKERELYVSQTVAEAINARDGSDYQVERPDGKDRFPDAVLISKSGRCRPREIEVTTPPLTPTIRGDNKNRRKFERTLKRCLEELGYKEGQVSVHWSDHAVLHGIADNTLRMLAAIVASQAKCVGSIGGEDLYEISPELCSAINYVSWGRVPNTRLHVASPFGFWSPRDTTWIRAAIQRKQLHRADGLILAVDGGMHIDSEQIRAFRAKNENWASIFAEIWVVNFSGAHQIFPAVTAITQV